MNAKLNASATESRTTEQGAGLDRRTFLGGVGLAAGAVMVGSFTHRAIARPSVERAPASAASVQEPDGVAVGPDELWDIDDMWGHRPRYAHPIAYARVQPAPAMWEQIDPVDRVFVC
jgi:hypothetical protein